MAERAGWNTGPLDINFLILLENKSEIQINVSERTLGDCHSDVGFPSAAYVAERITRRGHVG